MKLIHPTNECLLNTHCGQELSKMLGVHTATKTDVIPTVGTSHPTVGVPNQWPTGQIQPTSCFCMAFNGWVGGKINRRKTVHHVKCTWSYISVTTNKKFYWNKPQSLVSVLCITRVDRSSQNGDCPACKAENHHSLALYRKGLGPTG